MSTVTYPQAVMLKVLGVELETADKESLPAGGGHILRRRCWRELGPVV